jgi:RimJ/RimL family protein N-acetyltransferase
MEPPSPVVLEGRHVRLEPLSLSHLPGLLAVAECRRETFGLTSVPRDRAGLQRYLDTALADAARGQALPFATVDSQSNRVLGSTRFFAFEFWPVEEPDSPLARPPGIPQAVEIGWTWLAPEAQRTPINTEAKRLMLALAFERWGVLRVSLKTDERNLRSRAAIERLGAKLDGILRANMPASDGGVRNTAYYSLLASEWPTVRARLDARLARGAASLTT